MYKGNAETCSCRHCNWRQVLIKCFKLNFFYLGLSGGEEKHKFWRVVAECCKLIPDNIPRYVMGVGHSVDMIVASLLGAGNSINKPNLVNLIYFRYVRLCLSNKNS